MIPMPKEMRGIPIHPDQMRLQIEGLQAELQMRRARIEALIHRAETECAWVKALSSMTMAAQKIAQKYADAIEQYAEAEANLLELDACKLEAEINIKKAMLEDASNKIHSALV